MRANNLNELPEQLADWLVTLIAAQSMLRINQNLQSFLAFIADEDIETISDLCTLFDEWVRCL